MLARTIKIKNGDFMMPFSYFKCDRCGEELPESAPREDLGIEDFCGECAFALGLIDEKHYLEKYCYWICVDGLRAVIHDGKIHVGTSKFEWERTSRDRESAPYRKWRTQVFERDLYTCQKCGKKGGTLNAHHIKQYAKYPELRLELDNGITLCEKCHKEAHKKGKVHG